MKAELQGGPHDGQQMNVPSHLLFVRIPVPGSAQFTTPTFDDPTQAFASSLWVASYERFSYGPDIVYYRYIGQEHVTS